MRRALVTGATGGLGAELVAALLAHGYDVRATGRDERAGERVAAAGARFLAADLNDASVAGTLVEGIDVVFHAAALSSPWGRFETFQAINVDATRRLLAAARQAGCGAFVFVSTPSVYSEERDRIGLTEQSLLAERFGNAYVVTKYAAERLVLAANAPDFKTVTIRPRALVGPSDKALLPRLLRVARRGRFPLLRGGQALIELTDLRDAAEALIAADRGREQAAGKVYNIAGGAPLKAVDLLEKVFAAFGLSPRLLPLPWPLAAGLATLAETLCAALPGRPEPPATRYSLSTLAFSQTFDLTGAKQGLGWAPRFSPEEAIARTAAFWRSHAPL